MISSQDLALKNDWWENDQYKAEEAKWEKRDLYNVIVDNIEHPLMLNIVGLRRVGKSTIVKQLICRLLEEKVEPKNIFYFLFDYASQIQKAEFLDEVLSVYFKDIISKPSLSLNKRVYILLDEIQYIEDWQSVLKKYYDLSGKKIKFIITGSQTVLLKGKYQESLAGRIFDFYLPPMSFREFVKINCDKVKLAEKFDLFKLPEQFGELSIYDAHHSKEIAELSREYITAGQFPETLQIASPERKHEYIVESVIGKVLEDCIRIFNIEKTDQFKLITRQLINNAGSIFELKNIGREAGVSFVTLDKYLKYLKDSYVVEILYKYHKSPIKQGRILKKLYTTCINFTCALNHFRADHVDEVPQAFGKIIENAVYNVFELKYKTNKLTDNLSFWRQGEKEIDFIINLNSKLLPVEVKFSNNISSKELSVLTDYMKIKKLGYGVVVTKSEINRKKINGQELYFIPYYLILLMI
ncbi:ATP-binding protein [Candidatus Parcubacteria bacterium]|nr:ATP-binding protein [Candidatus Parcubacteria bacterium]